MFIGLFIVVAEVGHTPLAADMLALAARFRLERTGVLSAVAAVLSSLVS